MTVVLKSCWVLRTRICVIVTSLSIVSHLIFLPFVPHHVAHATTVMMFNNGEFHLSKTVHQQCPCSCITCSSRKICVSVKNWPLGRDKSPFHPPACQRKTTHQHCQTSHLPRSCLDVTIPTLDTSTKLALGPCLGMSPKCKDLHGRCRHWSDGEINSSAHKSQEDSGRVRTT